MFPLALMIGGALVSGLSKIAEHKAQKKAAKENKKAAIDNLKLMYNDLNARATQEKAAASQTTEGIQMEGEALRGSTATSAAAGNVQGATVDALLRDVSAQEGRATDTVRENLSMTLGQVGRQKQAAQLDATNRINSVKAPGWGSLALGLAGTALDTMSAMKGR